MNYRSHLLTNCKKFTLSKTAFLQNEIEALEKSLQTETKSSAGDKYETSREMLTAEINKLGNQLEHYRKFQSLLQQIENRPPSQKIGLGSVVKTNQFNYFIAIPAGKIEIEGQTFYAIGLQSPIAQSLLGKTEKESFTFKGNSYKILEVL